MKVATIFCEKVATDAVDGAITAHREVILKMLTDLIEHIDDAIDQAKVKFKVDESLKELMRAPLETMIDGLKNKVDLAMINFVVATKEQMAEIQAALERGEEVEIKKFKKEGKKEIPFPSKTVGDC